MKINENTTLTGKNVVLAPYRKKHVPKYHDWMQSPELQQLTASEPLSLEQEYEMQNSWRVDEDKCTFIVLEAETFRRTGDEREAMVGDVNLFFNDMDDRHSAELEVMIAEPCCRRKGLGSEATLAMMRYASSYLKVKKFSAKIGYENVKSQNMFTKFRFKEVSKSEVFREVTLELELNEENSQWLLQQTAHIDVQENGSLR